MRRAVVAAMCFILFIPLVAKAAERKFQLKIGFSAVIEDPRAVGSFAFKKEIEEKSGGTLTAEIYPAGQLGSDAALIEALSLDSGTVDIIISDAANFATYEPKMGISALPFNFKSYDEAWGFMDSDIQRDVEKLLLNHNMRVLTGYCNGFRCVTTSKTVINSPEDMKGLLIRTPENLVIMATMRALGANPQPLAFSEVYMALQQGTYDAQENPIPTIWNSKFYEVQKNLAITNHSYSGMCFAISETVWDQLSENQRAIVETAAKNSAQVNRNLSKQMAEDFIVNLKEKGMKITEPDLGLFMEATRSVVEDNRNLYGEELLSRLETWKASR